MPGTSTSTLEVTNISKHDAIPRLCVAFALGWRVGRGRCLRGEAQAGLDRLRRGNAIVAVGRC
jgi:hypothetical protein